MIPPAELLTPLLCHTLETNDIIGRLVAFRMSGDPCFENLQSRRALRLALRLGPGLASLGLGLGLELGPRWRGTGRWRSATRPTRRPAQDFKTQEVIEEL